MNKTLSKEYIVGNIDVQEQYYFIFNGGKTEDIRNALAYIDELPVLNKEPIKVRNRKGQMIALVGTKGGLQTFSTDYCNKNWYFDGNKLGKRKRLLVEAFYSDKILESINTDGINKVWKKISKRANH